ncbi:MAG: DUF167 domain-containing protein [Spirochaetaceae bacterium]|jgi:uncharacterized protein (TIGR00251 family)|nr:DUF167 domain-containing protein [Spirochaetaceae bacterium]
MEREKDAACMRIAGDAIHLSLKVLPGASSSRLLEAREGRLRVKIAAPPEDGKANAALRDFLAKLLGCPKKSVAILSGEKSRLKTVSLPLSLKEKLGVLLENR